MAQLGVEEINCVLSNLHTQGIACERGTKQGKPKSRIKVSKKDKNYVQHSYSN